MPIKVEESKTNFNMKQISLIIFALLIGYCLFAVGKPEEDEYIGMILEDVIKELGQPDYQSLKIIDKDYQGYEYEPDYSTYFSAGQLEQSVTVNVISYEKRRERIIIWFKKMIMNGSFSVQYDLLLNR